MFRIIKSRVGSIAASSLALLLASGCIAIGGSDRYEAKNPTLGKQLQDLKVARDSGAVNDAEYQQAKSKLLSDAR